MKKRCFQYISIFVLSLIVYTAQAQERRFDAAILMGGNAAQVDGDNLYGYHKIGLRTGLQVSARLSDRWALSMGMIYNQKGSRASKDELFFYYNKVNFNTIDVPVMIQISDWKFRAAVGVSYNRLISFSTFDNNGNNTSNSESFRSDMASGLAAVYFKPGDVLGVCISYSKSIFNWKENAHFKTREVGVSLFYDL